MTAASGSVATVRKRATFLLAGLTALTVAGFAFTLARPSTAGSPARLEVVDSNVQIRPPAASAFDTVESVTDLAGGSQVRTDDTGSAEIDYSDGSLTRIGPNSQYKVEALQIRGDQRQIVGRLEVGRTFHQVSKLSGSDSRFEVHTANAVAAVRGTAFTVNCKVRLVCDFGVTEGVVNVRGSDGSQVDLLAGQSVTVTGTGSVGEVSLLSQSDPWLAENGELPRPGDFSQSKVGSASSGTTTPANEREGALPATDARPPRSFSSTAAPTPPGSAPSPSAPARQSTPSPTRDVNDSFPPTATTSSPPTTEPRATSTTRPDPTSTTRPAPTSTTARPVTSTTRPAASTSTTQRSTTSTRPTSSTSTPPTPPTTVRSTTSTTAVHSTTTTVGGPDPVTTTTSTTGSTTTTSTTVAPTTTTTEQETTTTTEQETTTTTEQETTTTTEQETTTTTRDTSPSSTIPVCPEGSKNAGNPPPCDDEGDDDGEDDEDGEDGGTTTTSTSSTTTTTTTTTTIPPETTTTTSTSTTSTSTTTTEQETTTTTRDHTPSSTIPVCPDDSPNAGNPPPCGNEGEGKDKDKEKSKEPD